VGAPGELEANIGRYRAAVAQPTEQAGLFKNDQVGAFTLVLCDEDDRAARELGGENGLWYFETIKKLYSPVWQGKTDEEIPPSYRWHALNVTQAERLRSQEKLDYNALIDSGAFCMGNPDSCIKAIEKYEAAGADQLLAFMQIGRVPHEKIMNSLRLFGKDVIPHFRETEKRDRAAAVGGGAEATRRG
jgi:alkanesulfonate monooxygenase SsuD/methylene tetrahydromethanopterin reductase-like flavin-dependent oxidoreductase (luciferase family)